MATHLPFMDPDSVSAPLFPAVKGCSGLDSVLCCLMICYLETEIKGTEMQAIPPPSYPCGAIEGQMEGRGYVWEGQGSKKEVVALAPALQRQDTGPLPVLMALATPCLSRWWPQLACGPRHGQSTTGP